MIAEQDCIYLFT